MVLKKMETQVKASESESDMRLNPAVALVGQIIDDLRREGRDADEVEKKQIKE